MSATSITFTNTPSATFILYQQQALSSTQLLTASLHISNKHSIHRHTLCQLHSTSATSTFFNTPFDSFTSYQQLAQHSPTHPLPPSLHISNKHVLEHTLCHLHCTSETSTFFNTPFDSFTSYQQIAQHSPTHPLPPSLHISNKHVLEHTL